MTARLPHVACNDVILLMNVFIIPASLARMNKAADLTPEYIDSTGALHLACDQLKGVGALCVDTEFHRESTYYPEFALIQVATRGVCYLIDPVAISDLSPLWALMRNPDILKVFHAVRQDAEIILKESGSLPLPLFDTQVAAALLGFGSQVGFGNLVQCTLGKSLPKAESFTDWLRRPLRPAQLSYAADDVIYLMPVYQHLREQLQASARLTWLDEEQAALCSEGTYTNDSEHVFWRVKGVNKLQPRQLAVLRALAAWRERQAKQQNIPRRRIVADEPLLTLARKLHLTIHQLPGTRGLNNGTVRRFGKGILHAWQQGQQCPECEWPTPKVSSRNSDGTEMRLELLSTLVRLRAKEVRISGNILASKQDIASLASWANDDSFSRDKLPDNPCLHGWRRDLVGNDMLRMLEGELCLRLDAKTKIPVIDVLP